MVVMKLTRACLVALSLFFAALRAFFPAVVVLDELFFKSVNRVISAFLANSIFFLLASSLAIDCLSMSEALAVEEGVFEAVFEVVEEVVARAAARVFGVGLDALD